MCTNCGSAASGGQTIVRGDGGITVGGSGTPTDPYIITVAQATEELRFTVRDSDTVNLQLTGSGSTADPFVLRADTSSASNLRGLGDVASSPSFVQGMVPMWAGATAGGNFAARLPGTRYTTSTTRGNGYYQGEVARDTDTQKRYEWDGGQWLSLDVSVPSFALDPSVVQNAGTVTSSTDWSTLTTKSGIYRVSSGVSSSNNAPSGAYGFGTLEVLISGLSVTQNYYTHGASRTYTRTKWNTSDWTAWVSGATGDDTANLQTSINSLNSNKADISYVNGQVTPLSNTVGNIAGSYMRRSNNSVVYSASGTATSSASNTLTTTHHAFPSGLFGSKPYVVVSPETSRPDVVQMSVKNIDQNGCDIVVYRPDNGVTGYSVYASA